MYGGGVQKTPQKEKVQVRRHFLSLMVLISVFNGNDYSHDLSHELWDYDLKLVPPIILMAGREIRTGVLILNTLLASLEHPCQPRYARQFVSLRSTPSAGSGRARRAALRVACAPSLRSGFRCAKSSGNPSFQARRQGEVILNQ